MLTIDLNVDLGEGMPDDEALMPYLSSVNIACGGHAGDESSMMETVSSANKYMLAIGAHPSFPDRMNFGRTDMIEKGLDMHELADSLAFQIKSLEKICEDLGVKLHHVKAHGALYNRACLDHELALLICEIIRTIDPFLFMYGMGGTEMEQAARNSGIHFVREAFADRVYLPNGLLKPRSVNHALIEDPQKAVRQVMQLIQHETLVADNGDLIQIKAESICVHSDSPNALAMAREIHHALQSQGVIIRPKQS
jgi:UPF0271 protein